MRTRSRYVLAAFIATAMALAGCSAGAGSADAGRAASGTASSDSMSGELTVFAAASLKAAFTRLADQFQAAHPGVTIRPISYDGSSTLATQLIEGAPADVFASADEKNMQKVVAAGLASSPQPFATNVLTLIVPSGNPAGVHGLADLDTPSLRVVLCAAEVPCGEASQTLLQKAGVTASVDSYEQNVTAVLTKVASGEADAGLVYVTDAATTPAVQTVATPGADAVVNTYPIVAMDDAAPPPRPMCWRASAMKSARRSTPSSALPT